MDQLNSVNALLESFFDQKTVEATKIHPRYGELCQEIKYYLLGGGKRIRPQIVLMAYKAYGGKDREAIVSVAAAWEMLHTCLLVHDDIIDRDTVRHNKPNIAGRYQTIYGDIASTDTSHYALSAALLAGDLLLMSASDIILESSLENDLKVIAQRFINKATFAVGGGELIDTDAVLYPVDQSDPYSVALYKTASYSLQLPLQCGATLAGATEGELQKLSDIGAHTGIAFQLKDDLLGVFSDSDVIGKSNRSDILEKKRTLLIHKTIELSSATDKQTLLRIFAPDHIVSDEEAEEIVRIITDSGAKEHIEQIITDESDQALAIIKSLSVNEAHKQAFHKLVSKLVTRSS